MLSPLSTRSVRRVFPSIVAFSKGVLDLAKMLLGWLRELLGQKRASQGRRADPKPEMGQVADIKDEDDEAVVYEDARPVGWSRRKLIVLATSLSRYCSLSRCLGS